MLTTSELIGRFVKWLERFDQQHARNWARLSHNDWEAALWEATLWGVLTDCGVQVKPNADLSGTKRAPDFLCHQGEQMFFAEATVVRIAAAAKKTGLPHPPRPPEVRFHYTNLNEAILAECCNKVAQCAQSPGPCLVAIGTLHYEASVVCVQKHHLERLLTGSKAFAIDVNFGEDRTFSNPYPVTNLDKPSLFLRPGADGIEYARSPISAVLVGGLGCRPPNIFGLLNPHPKYRFDRTWLRAIEFCRVKEDFDSGILETEWI